MQRAALAFLLLLELTGLGYSQHNPAAAKQAKAEAVKIVNGPVIEEVTDHSAIIAWSTNVRGSSIVRYGTEDEKLAQTAEVPYGGPTHRVHLDNLKPSTKYFFVVDSGQGKGTGTEAKSQEMSFTTPAKGQKHEKYPKAGPGE